MNVETGREFLDSRLSPLLPAAWKILPYDDAIDPGTHPAILYRVQRLVKHPVAPSSVFLATWILTVISPSLDPAQEDTLDDLCMDLLDALRQAKIPWTTAERVVWGTGGGKLPAYDVEIQLPTVRTPKTTTTTEPTEEETDHA